MKVTEIVEISKSRSKVYIEQEFAFVLYKGELRQYGIRVGEDITEKDYDTIVEEILPKRAKLRAMNLLKNREYTTAQLYAKLKQGYYPEQVIQEALDYVASYHYIDDLRYAVSYITYHENTKSRKRMEQDLLNKGITKATLEQAWSDWEEQGGSQDERAMIKSLLAKKKYDSENADYKEQQKMVAFLIRKGFTCEQIRRAMQTNIEL